MALSWAGMTPEGAAHFVLFQAMAIAFGASVDDGERIAIDVLNELRATPLSADSAMQAIASIKRMVDDA